MRSTEFLKYPPSLIHSLCRQCETQYPAPVWDPGYYSPVNLNLVWKSAQWPAFVYNLSRTFLSSLFSTKATFLEVLSFWLTSGPDLKWEWSFEGRVFYETPHLSGSKQFFQWGKQNKNKTSTCFLLQVEFGLNIPQSLAKSSMQLINLKKSFPQSFYLFPVGYLIKHFMRNGILFIYSLNWQRLNICYCAGYLEKAFMHWILFLSSMSLRSRTGEGA